jgi:hypothetical protein
LKARAARSHTSLSNYLAGEIARLASEPDMREERLTPAEFLARLKTRSPVTLSTPVEDIIRHHRDGYGGSPGE